MIKRNKKILLVTEVGTHPQNRGNSRRVYDLIDSMQEQGYEVYCLMCGSQEADRKAMRDFFNGNIAYVKKESLSGKSYRREFMRSALLNTKFWKKITIHHKADELYEESVGEKALRLHEKYHFDVIWLEYVKFSKLFTKFDNSVLKVIDTHDVFAYRERMFLAQNMKPEMFYMTKHQEKKGLERADVIVSIQDKETAYFQKLFHNKKVVVTIGDRRKAVFSDIAYNKDILFVGADYGPNITAIKWFVHNVFPQILEQDAEVRLLVAGKVCGSIETVNNVIKLGYVEDLDDLYANVRIVINPIRFGTGLNIKSIEALSHLRPLVTTTIGAKGISGNGREIFKLANTEKQFVQEIMALIKSDNICHMLQDNIRHYIEQYNKGCYNNISYVLERGSGRSNT